MFVITTDPNRVGKTWTQPLFWDGHGVVGILRSGEAQRFSSREQAEVALADISPRTVRFHELAVAWRRTSATIVGW
jgi:hypothetical protein